MKTTDEIRQALIHCNVDEYSDDIEECCQECPYLPDVAGESCLTDLHMDAALMMTELEDQNRALTTELTTNRKPDTKADDQEAKQDNGKLDPTLVPTAGIWAIAAIRQFGLTKYKDPLNYRTVAPERLRAAAYRHFLKYIDDPERLDGESGYPHLWHCVTNLFFLCELEDYRQEGVDVNDE